MTRAGPIGRIFVAVLFIELIANLDAGILPVCAVGAVSPFSLCGVLVASRTLAFGCRQRCQGTLIHVKNHFDLSYGDLGILGGTHG